MARALVFIGICLLVSGLTGCGGDETVFVPDAGELISEGWKEYGYGNYEDAIAKYEEALEEDSSSGEAHNGIAWAQARLGRIGDSIRSFKTAIGREPANVDAHAGLAGMYLADSNYEQAIASGILVLSLGPGYESHHDDIGTDDIRVLLAKCYYNVGEYSNARAQIDLLGGSGRSLDPASPTYQADLLSVIGELAKKSSLLKPSSMGERKS